MKITMLRYTKGSGVQGPKRLIRVHDCDGRLLVETTRSCLYTLKFTLWARIKLLFGWWLIVCDDEDGTIRIGELSKRRVPLAPEDWTNVETINIS